MISGIYVGLGSLWNKAVISKTIDYTEGQKCLLAFLVLLFCSRLLLFSLGLYFCFCLHGNPQGTIPSLSLELSPGFRLLYLPTLFPVSSKLTIIYFILFQIFFQKSEDTSQIHTFIVRT